MNQSPAYGFSPAVIAGEALFFLIALIVGVFIQWKIATKAGYNGALSLLMLIPFVNFVIILLFAFREWPVERELKAARGAGAPYPPATL